MFYTRIFCNLKNLRMRNLLFIGVCFNACSPYASLNGLVSFSNTAKLQGSFPPPDIQLNSPLHILNLVSFIYL